MTANNKYAANDMWDRISGEIQGELSNESHEVSSDFRRSKANSRISLYGCDTHGLFFLKHICFGMAKSFSPEDLKLLEKVSHRNLGNPFEIQYGDIVVDLDYLQALDEITFVKKELGTISTILEIGSGYGRSCHTILELFPHIQSYTLLDLPEILTFAHGYLQEVLPETLFRKIRFLNVADFERQEESLVFDLAVNIDSMQEMSAEVVRNYLLFISKKCHFFYTKNTIGKFFPEDFGFFRAPATKAALSSGVLTEEFNIFSPVERSYAQKKFLEVFSPGCAWVAIKHEEAPPWAHYYQALFAKK